MSIGIWNASKDVEYSTPQQPLIAPCNVECYVDELGDFVKIAIPQGYSVPVRRKFRIPSHLPTDVPIDVAVGVWGSVEIDPHTGRELGRNPICFVYFKNVTYITSEPSTLEIVSSAGSGFIDSSLEFIGRTFGITDKSYQKYFVWTIISLLTMGISAWLSKSPIVSGLSLLSMLVIGTVIGWFPAWVSIVLIIIAGIFFAKMFGVGI